MLFRATTKHRGHTLYSNDDELWYFEDDNSLYTPGSDDKPCTHCGKKPIELKTPVGNGADACWGILPGVWASCCGHGDIQKSYISFGTGYQQDRGECAPIIANIPLGTSREEVLTIIDEHLTKWRNG
ncbi:MAG: hypothetical protein H8D23_21205 [Candidatus Brocadiales bacterium]|nr:hypothetical protein [Candidatus Brocadiales bacterium]